MLSLHDISWRDYEALPIESKVPLLARQDGMPFHTLFAQQFGRKELDRICDLATKIRFIAKSRDERRFDSLEARKAQLAADEAQCRAMLTK